MPSRFADLQLGTEAHYVAGKLVGDAVAFELSRSLKADMHSARLRISRRCGRNSLRRVSRSRTIDLAGGSFLAMTDDPLRHSWQPVAIPDELKEGILRE